MKLIKEIIQVLFYATFLFVIGFGLMDNMFTVKEYISISLILGTFMGIINATRSEIIKLNTSKSHDIS